MSRGDGGVRLGLMADTHDDQRRAEAALGVFEDRDVDAILHLGDLASPEMVELFEGWEPVWIVEGNVDRRRDAIREGVRDLAGQVRYDDAFDLELGTCRVGICHGHDPGRLDAMIAGGAFDLIGHGHTHTFRDETIGGTRVVNPGALYRTSTPSVAVYETTDDVLERIEI